MKYKLTSLFKGLFIGSIVLGIGIIISAVYRYSVFAQNSTFEFPTCESRWGEIGNVANYSEGWHQIFGGGLLEGSDDVYSLNDSNYLQCYCSTDEKSGIQTWWWRIGDWSQELIDQKISEGWSKVNGVQWNLGDFEYLARNADYDCSQPTPTPTLTPTPTETLTPTPTVTSTPSPTPTNTPSPTPTTQNEDEPESRCVSLSASPSEGTAPLTVKFTGSGFDEDGDIKRYRFDFGDASDGQPQVWEQEGAEAGHRYQNPGTYTASLSVQDSRNNWRDGQNDCKKTIKVSGVPQVLGGSTVKELPKTGSSIWTGLFLITFGASGLYLYKRFKLV